MAADDHRGLPARPEFATSVHLSWTGSPGATGYIIEVGVMVNGQIVWTVVALVPNGTGGYTITGLNPDTTYYFRVIAYNGSNDSTPSYPPGASPGDGGIHTPGYPPDAPNLTSATGVSQSEIDLTWTAGTGTGGAPTSYTIQRAPDDGSSPPNWQPLVSLPAPDSSYQDSNGLASNTSYLYRTYASNAWGDSGFSSTVTGTTLPPPPAAPLAFTAVAGSTPTVVNLMWQPSGDMAQTGYTIQRSTTGNVNNDSDWHTVLNPGATAVTATDTTCQPATTYYYRICAVNRGGASAWVYASAVTTLTPPAPNPPSGLTAVGVSSSEIDLSWTDNSVNAPNGGQATGFQIQRHIGPAGTGTYDSGRSVAALPTTYADTGLTPNTTYTYRVRATNAGGYSTFSNEATATTISGTTGGGPAPAGIYISNLAANLPGILDNGTAVITVTLNQAPTVPVSVTLGCTNSGVATLSSTTVTVAAGQTTATLLAHGVPGGADALGTTVYIRGDCGGWTQGATLTVVPANTNFTPQNVIALSGNGCVVLQWDGPPDNSVKGFHIYRRSNQGFAVELTASAVRANLYADTGLDPNTSYSYEIGVEYWNGSFAAPSAWVSASPITSGPSLAFDASLPANWSGTVTVPTAVANATVATTTTLLVDGSLRGNGGAIADGSGNAGVLTNSINSASLGNGSHVIQVIGIGSDQSVCATPPLTIAVSNGVTTAPIDMFIVTDTNELALISSSLPAGTLQASISITDESGTAVLQRTTAGPQSTLCFAWDGTNGTPGMGFLAEQNYTITTTATDSQGNQTSSSTKVRDVSGPCKALVLTSNMLNTIPNAPYIGTNDINDTIADIAAVAFGSRVNGVTRQFIENYGGSPINPKHRVDIIHWLQSSVSDLYVNTHGLVFPDGGAGILSFNWAGIDFRSSRGPYRYNSDPIAALVGANPVAIMDELLSGIGSRYEFVFMDTCVSAGGTTLPGDCNDTSSLTSTTGPYNYAWARDFGIQDNGDDDSCFIGWNGLTYCDRYAEWTDWRKKFWTVMGQGGFVSQAIGQAMEIVANYTPMYMSPAFINQNVNPNISRSAVVGDTQLGSK